MSTLSPEDKINLSAFIESSTTSLARMQATLPLVQDTQLKQLLEGSIRVTETQLKGVQDFCRSHGVM